MPGIDRGRFIGFAAASLAANHEQAARHARMPRSSPVRTFPGTAPIAFNAD